MTTMVVKGLGTRWVTIGTFYLGGSSPRTWTLTSTDSGAVYITGYNTGGSFHSTTGDIAGELRHADNVPDPDDPSRCRDHHAFAASLRSGLAALGLPDPTA